MILISHRGNINGKNPKLENTPDYIQKALNLGYDVEIDIWYNSNFLSLGHDKPTHAIEIQWIIERSNKLWIHCKNIEAMEYFNKFIDDVNYFWHETDTTTLTSQRYIWAYPGKQPIKDSIAVMPEIYKDNLDVCKGICSDNIIKYKK